MKLEDQVVSLELAKKLKALNVKQESLFCWSAREAMDGNIEDKAWHLSTSPFRDDIPSFHSEDNDAHISAFTVAELLQIQKEPVLVPVDGSAADYLADLIIKQHENGSKD